MFGLAFRFPAGRYHATPWGRNVNEADVAWPPEPWRVLRALVACYRRKGDWERWSEDDLARLIETLAEELPVFHLPERAIHAHTRHYMPKGKEESKKTLVFDAFLHVPDGAEVSIVWPDTTLGANLLDLAEDLASGMGYLGRAESWTECRVVTEIRGRPNCGPAALDFSGERCRVLVPRSAASYQAERERLIGREAERLRASSKEHSAESVLRDKAERAFRAKGGADTLPARLLDALSLETVDLQDRRWDRPPAAYGAIYSRSASAGAGVVARSGGSDRRSGSASRAPTIARYLLAGRPRPRIEDAVRIGEVMRAAAMSKYGWEPDERVGKCAPLAPWQISGRGDSNRPVRDPTHAHAFWLPEDDDDDGWIDHVTVFIASGMDVGIRSHLDRITRIWLTPGKRGSGEDPKIDEWRLALEGFGHPEDFGESSRLLGHSRRWRSITPFLAAGHLKRAGYRGELIRLLKRRGINTEGVEIEERMELAVGGMPRRALNYRRFRSRGREPQPDTSGTLLEIEFPRAVRGPLALGYASHFGLGMFGASG